MNVVVDNLIHVNLNDLPDDLLVELKQGCTYPNPEYAEALIRFNQSQKTYFDYEKKVFSIDDMFLQSKEENPIKYEETQKQVKDLKQFKRQMIINNSRLSKTPVYLHTYFLNDKELLLPRGKINFFKETLARHNISLDCIVDNRKSCTFKEHIPFKDGRELFDYQKNARDQLVKYTQRLLSSDCGSGKTVIGCGIVQALQQHTLVVVDMVDLLEQWSNEFNSFLDLPFKVGKIGAGKFEIAPITVALVQTLNTLNDDEWKVINDNFGCILYDEVQGLPAPTRFEITTKFKAKYLYGLSATIKRSDGIEFFTYDSISHNIVSIDPEELKSADRFLDIELTFVKSFTIKNSLNEFKFLNWNKLIDRLIYSNERNGLIVNDIKEMVALGHKCLVLSSRVEHCHILADLLNRRNVKAEVYIGDTKKENREDIKQKLETNEISCMIATYQCAQKALNIPCLSCLHLPLPIKDKYILQQATGRIRRVYAGKLSPVVRDYVDMSAPILKKKAKNRSVIYQNLNYISILNNNDLFVKSNKF